MFRAVQIAPCLLALAATACSTSPAPAGPETDTDTPAPAATVTYTGHAQRVLATHCVGCHADGGVAPFSLATYDDAAPWAQAVAASVAERIMPPFNARNDGFCQTFDHARTLNDSEIGILGAWAAEGAAEGDPSLPPTQAPSPVELVGGEIVTVATPDGYSTGEQQDDYQCFLVSDPAQVTRYLVGFDVLPGNPGRVHHVLGFNIDLDAPALPNSFGEDLTNGELIGRLDAETNEPGWDCFGAAGSGVGIQGVPMAWAPGAGAVNFPEGTGLPIAAGEAWVLQLHLYGASSEIDPPTQVKMAYADEVTRPARANLWDNFLFAGLLGGAAEIDAGKEETTFKWTSTVKTVTGVYGVPEVDLFAIVPHMHKRGTSMSVRIFSEESETCAIEVDRWDFDWQQYFFYKSPLRVGASDTIEVTCRYDTSADEAPVKPGFGTDEEMCLVGLYAAPAE